MGNKYAPAHVPFTESTALHLDWRCRVDASDRTCFLSQTLADGRGRYLVHQGADGQWVLTFDEIGSEGPKHVARGSLDDLQAIAQRRAKMSRTG